ncbi:MAG: glycosyltransferase family 2 protein [Bacteroidota bacterium]
MESKPLNETNFCIFIPSYNAGRFLGKTVSRIPWDEIPSDLNTRLVFIDNCSQDNTWEVINQLKDELTAQGYRVDALKNETNIGYGGSIKRIYDYCIENDLGLLAILHADGQYSPEELPRLVGEFRAEPAYKMFYGSRLIKGALEGGMPRYKYYANIVLTWLQNQIMRSNLSEYHSGYRFYRVEALKPIPYHANSDYFDFDMEIIFQILHAGYAIGESYIPTHYGEEVSHVSPIRTPLGILANASAYWLHRSGLRKDPRYDFEVAQTPASVA